MTSSLSSAGVLYLLQWTEWRGFDSLSALYIADRLWLIRYETNPAPSLQLLSVMDPAHFVFFFVRFQAGSGRDQRLEALTAGRAAAPTPQKKMEETQDLTEVQERRRGRDWKGRSEFLTDNILMSQKTVLHFNYQSICRGTAMIHWLVTNYWINHQILW